MTRSQQRNSADRRWWRHPSWWVAVGVAGRQVVGLAHLRQTLAWVDHQDPGQHDRRDTATSGDQPFSDAITVHFVIPVLREQAHVPSMMSLFVSLLSGMPGSSLSVVTTERETREREHLLDLVTGPGTGHRTLDRVPQLSADERAALARCLGRGGRTRRSEAAAVLDRFPTTEDVVAAELAKLQHSGLQIRHVHYQGDGRKAAQVNYAVAGLSVLASGYVAVYDVDSRPASALLERTLSFAARRRVLTGELPAVLQQSARFTSAGSHPQAWQRVTCRGAARLQTLWTLRREIPAFRRYASAVTRRWPGPVQAIARGLAQTVGHGLLIRIDVFRESGGLPTHTVLDDFPFGYRLTVDDIGVEPVPFTTTVPAPEEFRELIAQGQRWFHNYLDYPRCAAHARVAGHGTSWTRLVALVVGVYRGLTWLLRSPGMAVSIALLIGRVGWPTRIAAGVALGAGVVAPLRMLARAEGRPQSLGQLGREACGLVLANLLSSVGPVSAIAERIMAGAPGQSLSPKAGTRTLPIAREAVTR